MGTGLCREAPVFNEPRKGHPPTKDDQRAAASSYPSGSTAGVCFCFCFFCFFLKWQGRSVVPFVCIYSKFFFSYRHNYKSGPRDGACRLNEALGAFPSPIRLPGRRRRETKTKTIVFYNPWKAVKEEGVRLFWFANNVARQALQKDSSSSNAGRHLSYVRGNNIITDHLFFFFFFSAIIIRRPSGLYNLVRRARDLSTGTDQMPHRWFSFSFVLHISHPSSLTYH